MDVKEPPKLLDQVRQKIRYLHYSIKTEQSYVQWIRRYILFHNASSRGAALLRPTDWPC